MSADSKDPVFQFIDSIPDAKLLDLPKNPGARIFTTNDYRLDMQSMTSDKPAKHNIQVQVNNQIKRSTAKMIAGKSVTNAVLVPQNNQ